MIKMDNVSRTTVISIAKHAIGLDNKKPYKRCGKYFYRPYRNYYVASKDNCFLWEELVKLKYADAGKKNRDGSRTYWLTRSGLDWLGNELEITIHDEEE